MTGPAPVTFQSAVKSPSTFVLSLIRTYTPVAVGAVIAYFSTLSWASSIINGLTDSEKYAVIIALTGFLINLYYTLVRYFEQKYPWLGKLLGRATALMYATVSTDGAHVITSLPPNTTSLSVPLSSTVAPTSPAGAIITPQGAFKEE